MFNILEQPKRKQAIKPNLLTFVQATCSSTSGFKNWETSTIALDNTIGWNNRTKSIKVTCQGSATSEGIALSYPEKVTIPPNQQISSICIIKAPLGATLEFDIFKGDFSEHETVNFIGTGNWQEVFNTMNMDNSTEVTIFILTRTTSQAIDFNVGNLIVREGTY